MKDGHFQAEEIVWVLDGGVKSVIKNDLDYFLTVNSGLPPYKLSRFKYFSIIVNFNLFLITIQKIRIKTDTLRKKIVFF